MKRRLLQMARNADITEPDWWETIIALLPDRFDQGYAHCHFERIQSESYEASSEDFRDDVIQFIKDIPENK